MSDPQLFPTDGRTARERGYVDRVVPDTIPKRSQVLHSQQFLQQPLPGMGTEKQEANRDLYDNLRFDTRTIHTSAGNVAHRVTASDVRRKPGRSGQENRVGYLDWDGSPYVPRNPGTIRMVETAPTARRAGVAESMFKIALEHASAGIVMRPEHSEALSVRGKVWASSMLDKYGGRRPAVLGGS